MLQQWRPADEKELPIDLDAIAAHLNPGDMQAAWQKGLADDVALAFLKQLRLLQREGGTMDAAQMNAKFAGSTFEGAHGNLEEYLAGVEKHIGLTSVNMYDGMLCGQPRSRQDLPRRAPRQKIRRLHSCARGAETWRRASRHSTGFC